MPTCRVLCSLSRKFCTRAGRGLPQQRASAASSACKRCHRCRIHDFFRICRQGNSGRREEWTPPLGADARSIEPRQHHVQGRRFRPPRRDSANVIAASTNKAVQNRAEGRNVGMHKAALTRRRPCRGEGLSGSAAPASSAARERRRATSQIPAPAAAPPHSIVGKVEIRCRGTALTGKFVARIVFPAKEDVGRELFPAHSRSFVSLRRFYGEGIFLCPGKAALLRRLSAANARRQAFMPAAAILFGVPREDSWRQTKTGFPRQGLFTIQTRTCRKTSPAQKSFQTSASRQAPAERGETRRGHTARVGREEKLMTPQPPTCFARNPEKSLESGRRIMIRRLPLRLTSSFAMA